MSDYSWNSFVWAVTFRRVNEPASGKPILFSSAMVRAILRDVNPKTQTRRVIAPQPPQPSQRFGDIEECERYPGEWFQWDGGERGTSFVCPYGKPGDRLYVRETWNCIKTFESLGEWDFDYADPKPGRSIIFSADCDCREEYTWRPSIHMPRWASRITLEITEVRVQRVQEISGDDVLAEGCELVWGDRQTLGTDEEWARKNLYGQLWDSINGKRGPKRVKVAA